MYLKAIELSGFKSFAERVRLDFAGGLTAIVGANGSGKSNIIDAVLWVLGEQNARNLRGVRMEEVIFSGSEKKRAVGLAEVILYIDNTEKLLHLDYDEIAVMRRLYRDGTSEYYINQQACRLKDIVELFLDTGVGKDSFSIIGQGQVDEILSYKPEERRVILEEVAGISKFKYRKREALLKLNRLKDRLQRVNDILIEINNQIEPLEDQAKKAEVYLELRQELTAKERQFYEIERRRLIDLQASSAEKDRQNKDKYAAAQAALAAENAIRESLRLEQLKLEKETEDLSEKSAQLLLLLEQNRGQKELNRQQIEQLHLEELRLEEQIRLNAANKESLLVHDTNLEQEQNQLKLTIVELKAELETKGLEMTELLAQEEKRSREERDLTAQLQQEYSALSRYQGLLAGLIKEEKSRIEAIEVAQKSLKDLQLNKSELNQKIEETKSSFDQKQKNLSELQEKISINQSQLQENQSKISALTENLRQNETDTRLKQNRLNTLKDLADQMEGYQRGVRAVMQRKRSDQNFLSGLHDTIASLFKVKKEHETAIEMVLGGNLQFIVVDTPYVAEKAIDWLKNQRAGRATFYPLSTVRTSDNQSLYNRVKSEPGVIALASQLIETEPLYEKVANALLGNVIVLKDLASANKLAAKLNFRYRLVTLEGDLVYPSGAVTGGSIYNRGSSLLGRDREIAELEQDLKALSNQLPELKTELNQEENNLQSLAAENRVLRENESALKEELSEQNLRILQYNTQAENQDSLLTKSQTELKTWQTELETLKTEQAELKIKEEETQAQAEKLRDQIESLFLSPLALKIDDLRKELNAKEIDQAINNQKNHSLQEQKDLNKNRLLEIDRQLENLNRALAENKDNLSQKEKEEAKNLESNTTVLQEQRETDQSYQNKREKLQELRVNLEGQEERIYQARKGEDQAREAAYHSASDLAKVESEYQYLLEKIANDYEIEADQPIWQGSLDPKDGPELQRTCNSLRAKIRAMGIVNLGAIEELERLTGRQEYLFEQSEDIRLSCQGILKILGEIDKDMEVRFFDAYQKVNEKFKEVFQQLFLGGQASLQLTEPEDLLQTGLDIMAQLPGKRAGNLSLLSGGERALTAVALLIAILQVKVPPFVFLDEVETSLDEPNVKRVAAILRECSKDTQIISVSHRKGLMEEADALIGVTMQTPGISTVVSVRFGDKEKQE
ncbi:MAG: chromosome segregation protein SMC [Firmicutes bacterium]|nr:chromosome segregation protein SMC [Bacillota bacterium]